MDGEPVGLRHVDGDELNPGLHQPRDEMDVAGQPVELRNDKRPPLLPAQLDGPQQLRPVGVALAALDLGELGQ